MASTKSEEQEEQVHSYKDASKGNDKHFFLIFFIIFKIVFKALFSMVMFHVLTAIMILSFLWPFQMNFAIRKNAQRTTDDHGRTEGQTLI